MSNKSDLHEVLNIYKGITAPVIKEKTEPKTKREMNEGIIAEGLSSTQKKSLDGLIYDTILPSIEEDLGIDTVPERLSAVEYMNKVLKASV